MLRLAIQKKGRLSEQSIALLRECDISFPTSTGSLITAAYDFPMEILFLRDDDIPGYIDDHVADIGIVGENVLIESQSNAQVIMPLGFGRCRLSLAVPKKDTYDGLHFFEGKNIATTYPHILGDFLKKNNINAAIHEISGSVEIAPNIGLAEGICDIVSTGSTLLSNGLKEVHTVMESQAVLVAAPSLTAEKQQLVDKLLFRLTAVRKAQKNKYILLNAPQNKLEEITALLPGIKSPTVLPLAREGWCSIHSVITEKDFWDNIEKLKNAGAEGILVMPIEKLIY